MVVGKANRLMNRLNAMRKTGSAILNKMAPILKSNVIQQLIPLISDGALGKTTQDIVKALGALASSGALALDGDLASAASTALGEMSLNKFM